MKIFCYLCQCRGLISGNYFMKNKGFIFVTGFTLLFLAQAVWGQQSMQQQKDSLRRIIVTAEGEEKLQAYKYLSNIYFREVNNEGIIDILFALYDEMDAEAARQGNINEQAAVRTNRLSALSNRRQYDEVIRRAPAILRFLEEKKTWKFYYQSYEVLLIAYRSIGDYDRALNEARTMYDRAKELHDDGGKGVALYAMSRIYLGQRRFADQEQCLRESFDLLKDDDNYLNYLSTISSGLTENLIMQKRYDEALQAADATAEVNRRYEAAAQMPMPTAWLRLWQVYSFIYLNTHDYDNAAIYINKVDSISNGSMPQYEERATLYSGRGEYEKAIEQIDKGIEFARNKRQPKGTKLYILMDMGETEKAKNMFEDIVADLDSLNNATFTSRLDEIRTAYEVETHIAEKTRNRTYYLFALGGCLLLAVLLTLSYRHNRIVATKNRNLYLRIKEQDRLTDKLTELTRRYEEQLQAAPPSQQSIAVAEPLSHDRHSGLVDRLKEHMLSDNNLAKTDITRDEIANALATNRNTLSEAVKAVTGKTLMEYIRILQLEETRRLFDSHPELTVEAVASDCGIKSQTTFYRLFRKHYGISPSEYRKLANSPDNRLTYSTE